MADPLHDFINEFLRSWSDRDKLRKIEVDVDRLVAWAATAPTLQDLHHMEERMSAREDADYVKLNADIQAVKDGWAALVAQVAALTADNQTLRDALANADAAQSAAVEAALTADSETDADKIEAADTALAELLPPAPADGGDAPADGGDAPAE